MVELVYTADLKSAAERIEGSSPSPATFLIEFKMSQNLNIINTLCHTLSDSDLSDAISIMIKERKSRQGKQLLEMKSSLCKGDLVEFYHSSRGCYIRGIVTKTKTKKALVVEENSSMTWDVPMGMLKKVV